MTGLVEDTKRAWRTMRRAPGFTAVAVLTLGLGIGVHTFLFSVVNALLFKPMPGAGVDDVVVVDLLQRTGGRWQSLPLAPHLVAGLQASPGGSVAALGGVHTSHDQLVIAPRRFGRINIEAVTSGYSTVLRLRPAGGRWFVPSDDHGTASEPVAVVSDRFWREWLDGDPAAIGHTVVKVGRLRFRVVGIAPPGYRGLTSTLAPIDLWIPAGQLVPAEPDRVVMYSRQGIGLIARVDPEARDAAAGEIRNALAADIAGLETNAARVTLTDITTFVRPPLIGRFGWLVAALGVLVLLTSCANLANMLLARGIERARETSVRLSLGATRLRLFQTTFVEAAWLATAASVLGLFLAAIAAERFTTAYPTFQLDSFFELSLDLSLDVRVFAAAFGAGIFSAFAIGAITAGLLVRVASIRQPMASDSATTATARLQWSRTALVSTQVTLAFLLVMTTALGWEQLREALRSDRLLDYAVHFDPTKVLTARVNLELHDFTEVAGRAFQARVLEPVRRVTSIERAALADALPGSRTAGPRATIFEIVEDGPLAGIARRSRAHYVRVTPGFLATLGLRLDHGRDIAAADAEGAPAVAVVSRSMAAALWPRLDPIGRQLRFIGGATLSVVGVVEDPVSSHDTSALDPANFVFLPLAQEYRPSTLLVMRTSTPTAVENAVRAAVTTVDETVAVSEMATVEEAAFAWLRPIQVFTALLTSLGAVALGVALLGVYGVVAHFVGLRTREFGIRTALGATPRRIRRIVVDYTLHLMLVGLLPGVFLAASLTRLIQASSLNLMPQEISSWIVVPLFVLATGIAAGYLPARRAARVDPNAALREL